MTTPTITAATIKVGRPAPARRGRRRWIATTLAIVFSAIWFFPVYWMVNTALKPPSEVMTPTPLFFPLHPSFANFIDAVNNSTFLDNLKSSVLVVVVSVVVSGIIAFFATAALTRFRFRARRTIMVTILVIQMLPSVALLIPTFLVFNDFNLVGSYLGLILAYIAMVLPFSIWILRGFFVSVPIEIEEAARMDGASDWRVLWNVLFPLVAPGLISTTIFAFIAAWNEYIMAYTFMKDDTMYTLPIWLASFSTPTQGTDFGGQMAASVLFSLPVVVFFMIIQRRLVSGIAAGAVKG